MSLYHTFTIFTLDDPFFVRRSVVVHIFCDALYPDRALKASPRHTSTMPAHMLVLKGWS